MKKGLVVVLLLALVGALAWRISSTIGAAGSSGRDGPRQAGAVPVEVAEVGTKTLRDVARFSGSLVADSYFLVAPKVSGRLEKLLVDIGDEISSGDLLAVMDDDEYSQQVEQARAEVDVAAANVQEAESALKVEEREFERVQALRDKKIASESEFDSAGARFEAFDARRKVALAQVAQRQASLKAAEVRLSYTRITAAWDDPRATRRIGERFVDEGAMLRANDPIVSVIDISALTAVVHVIERDYSRIKVSQQASITSEALPGMTFTGTVKRLAPLLRESSRQARVEIEVPNTGLLLKPGMFALVEIELGRHDNATVVDAKAIARRECVPGVFLIDTAAKTASFVPVTLGITDDKQAEILDPPLSGLVATLGQHLLFDGASVTFALTPPPADEPSNDAPAIGDGQ